MFVSVKVPQNISVGDIVSYDSTTQLFTQASSAATLMGVIVESTTQDEDGHYYAPVTFAGIAWARASRDIPDEGGVLNVESGGVYVDSSSSSNSIISPLPKGSNSRLVGELIMICVR